MIQGKRLYSVRVDLPNARAGDADRLREAMWAAGFRQVFLADGKVSRLPEGSFLISTDDATPTVRANAQSVAKAIDPTCLVRAVPIMNWNVSMLSPADDLDAPGRSGRPPEG